MKKFKRIVAAFMLSCAFLLGSGSIVHVKADDQTTGPQGQQDSKSKGPSTSAPSQADLLYLWFLILWLLGWL